MVAEKVAAIWRDLEPPVKTRTQFRTNLGIIGSINSSTQQEEYKYEILEGCTDRESSLSTERIYLYFLFISLHS